jgi:MFS transporter, OPA family, sugar phosphate sensor protein UhpC
MLTRLVEFFRTGPDQPALSDSARVRRIYERRRWSVFISVTLGYALFYVCRTNFSVVKKPLLDAHILDATQMGLVGSAMLAVYAVGKFVNGMLADRSNIRRFISVALLACAVVNLALGASKAFVVFLVLWGVNGWFQSFGSAPSIVALSQWFTVGERGTRYGIWSASHSIGEGLTFLVTSSLISRFGWRWGFLAPGILGTVAAFVLLRTLADRPQTYGLPPVYEYKGERAPATAQREMGRLQLEVVRRVAVWIMGLAMAGLGTVRYGINNWGVLYLQTVKSYSLVSAGRLMACYPVVAVVGSMSAGVLSDRFFHARRHPLAAAYCLLVIAALTGLHLTPPGNRALDTLMLVAFGFAMGSLLVLMGLMVVDIVPPRVAGSAAGLQGMITYFGAAAQDAVSGRLIDAGKTVVGDQVLYSFGTVFNYWIVTAVVMLVLVCTTWRVPREA